MNAALDELLAAFVARWNAHDAAGFAALFAEDATFTDVVGQTGTGRAGIAEMHHYPFTQVQRLAVLTLNQVLWHRLAPTVAVGIMYWTTTGSQTPTGQPLPPRNGVLQLVARQHEQGWQVASVLNSDLERGPYAAHQSPVIR